MTIETMADLRLELRRKDAEIAEREATITAFRDALVRQGCACRKGIPSEGESPHKCYRCEVLESNDAGAKFLDEYAAQLAAYRKALERFTVYLPSIARHPDDARIYIYPSDAHCPTVGDFRHALTVLQSPDPGKALLEAHAAELERLYNVQYRISGQLGDVRQALGLRPSTEWTAVKIALEALRQALIETGRAIGCLLAEDVSTVFTVAGVPAEAKAVMQAHAAELAAVGEQLESDRTKIADCLTKANLAIDRRHWLTEGRGSYEWNDDRWHDEFRQAAIEIKDALAPLTKIAADWKDCPQTGESVARARLDLQAEIAALRQRAEAAERIANAQAAQVARAEDERAEALKRAEAAESALAASKCRKCKGQHFICSQSKRPWNECDCGWCERGPSTRQNCPRCRSKEVESALKALRATQALDLTRVEERYNAQIRELEEGKRKAEGARSDRQRQVAAWCADSFGVGHASSIPQRGIRLLEKAIEAAQACGCTAEMAHRLLDHVFARGAGELGQELGGVGVTLLALAAAAQLDADAEEAREVARVLSKPLEHFKARNQQKNAAGFNVADAPPTCPLCPHPKHEGRCQGEAPNAQFSCSCDIRGHGKHRAFCEECQHG